ncbi:hypothetical protein OUZ56_003488 [Daphnia magna]|uniref:Uncharacterized protein n=1 Tax=Daphnia magna TaxID=35525 RepID=A0ABR0A8X6_9CRUS|nr:hypothetical protein OUZ56_003488 [Daphnia magna]
MKGYTVSGTVHVLRSVSHTHQREWVKKYHKRILGVSKGQAKYQAKRDNIAPDCYFRMKNINSLMVANTKVGT